MKIWLKHKKNMNTKMLVAGGVGFVAVVSVVVVALVVFVFGKDTTSPVAVEAYVGQLCGEQGVLTNNTNVEFVRQTSERYDTVEKYLVLLRQEMQQLKSVSPPSELQAYHNSHLFAFQEIYDLFQDQDSGVLLDDVLQQDRLEYQDILARYGDNLAVAVEELSSSTRAMLESGKCVTDLFSYLEELRKSRAIIEQEKQEPQSVDIRVERFE